MGMLFQDGLLELFVLSILGQVYEKLLCSSIWMNPKGAMKTINQIFGQGQLDPCEAVHVGLVSAKVMQAVPIICAWGYFGSVPEFSLLNLTWCVLAAGGQYLNFSVYEAIGKDGVYYGVKFGKKIPWSTKFPYNKSWLKHPQYLGAYLFIISAVMLAFSSIEYSYKIAYIAVTGCIYIYISYVEQCL